MNRLSLSQRKTFTFIGLTYLLYFGQLGILTPYLGVFLDGRGFSSEQIGTLFALITLTRIIGPSLWAGFADSSGKPLEIMRFGCFLTAVFFTGVFFVDDFVSLTLVLGTMMMFWTAVLPQLEVITLSHLKNTMLSYGKIRLWGSIGFILCATIVGQCIDLYGSESPIYVSFLILVCLFVSSLFIKKAKLAQRTESHPINQRLILRKPFVVFIFSSMLLQMSFGVFYGFFALYVRDIGYSGAETGLLISLGVLVEIVMFLFASRIISRVGIHFTLCFSMVLTAVRWWLIGFAADFWFILLFAQGIHAFSFGLTHATSVQFIHQSFPEKFQSRGQAIYISLSFGIGGAIGHYVSGALWNDGQGASFTFAVSGVLSLIAGLSLLLCSPNSMNNKAIYD